MALTRPSPHIRTCASETNTELNEVREIVDCIRDDNLECSCLWQYVLNECHPFQRIEGQVTIVEVLRRASRTCEDSNHDAFRIQVGKLMEGIRDRSMCEGFRSQINMEFGKIFSSPYREAHHSIDSSMDAVKLCVTTGNIEMLELLLRYGATTLQPLDSATEWKIYMPLVVKLFIGIDDFFLLCHNHMYLTDLFHSATSPRMFLVMRCISVLEIIGIQRMERMEYKNGKHPIPIHTEKCIATLKLFFKSIPDAMVTSQEMRDVLNKIFQRVLPDPVQKVQLISKIFEKYFPESLEPSGPRSLMHLCRYQVRENMRAPTSRYRLPEGVDSLPLPRSVKNYILLK